MRTEQFIAPDPESLGRAIAASPLADTATLTLVFGAPELIADPALSGTLARALPRSAIAGCSTAGEISNRGVSDMTLVATVIAFDHVRVENAVTELTGMQDSFEAGERLIAALPTADLRMLLIFGQGSDINGSALIDGITARLGKSVPIVGGLAADGARFERTWVLHREGASDCAVVAVGLYGDSLECRHGAAGGWEPFGILRKVTRCDGNVLYELDGQPALDLYRRYLGDYASDLPASGLLFPFAMTGADRNSTGIIRTILAINEATQSLTLAGDIDPAGYLQLMHASVDRLVDGAESAAQSTIRPGTHRHDGLALLVSCVGRKLVMGERADEEVEIVSEIFGPGTSLAGFYSYGEISPTAPGVACRLHNQTMALTWIGEVPA